MIQLQQRWKEKQSICTEHISKSSVVCHLMESSHHALAVPFVSVIRSWKCVSVSLFVQRRYGTVAGFIVSLSLIRRSKVTGIRSKNRWTEGKWRFWLKREREKTQDNRFRLQLTQGTDSHRKVLLLWLRCKHVREKSGLFFLFVCFLLHILFAVILCSHVQLTWRWLFIVAVHFLSVLFYTVPPVRLARLKRICRTVFFFVFF